MTEDEARQVLLVRCVEEESPDRVLPEVATAASRAAGVPDDLGAWLLRRAQHVLARLPEAPRRLLGLALPPRELALAGIAVGAVLGLAGNALSTGRRIHVLANPVTLLLAWNGLVYAALALARIRGRSRNARPGAAAPTALRPMLAAVARASLAIERMRGREDGGAPDSRLAVRFTAETLAACRAPIAARVQALVHAAAIAFALGALLGIYVQGVAFAYRIEWGSTLVSSAESRAVLAALLFWPARLVLGSEFPGPSDFAQAAAPDGAPAAIWFHVFAVSVVTIVIVPRTALLALAWLRARRLARNVVLPLDDPAWRDFAERTLPPPTSAIGKGVVSQFSLDADACTVLASLQYALVADDIGATSAGGVRDVLARKKAWLERWRALVERGFAAFPDSDRPEILEPGDPALDDAAARVRAGPNAYAAPLVMLELAAFEAYWPLRADEVAWRDRFGLAPTLRSSVRNEALAAAAERLGRPPGEGESLRSALGASTRDLSGLWSKVAVGAVAGTAVGALTAGIAAPFAAPLIGKAVGAAGLLAIKAGLAALGGHAVIAAGLGAAGSGLVVGGGALLGLSAGPRGAAAADALTAASALLASAKIEVFLRHVVAAGPAPAATFGPVLEELRAAVARLRDELPAFRLEPAHDTKAVRERERVIAILARVVERNESWGLRHGIV